MPKWKSDKEIGGQIRQLRQARGDTQGEFAEFLGLKLPGGQTQVSGWEQGRGVAVGTLEKIAEKCAVPLSVFYTEEPTDARPLTTQDVARLRDEVRSLRDTADGVLAELEAALNGRATPTAKDAQTGATAMEGVKREDARHNGEGKSAARPRRRGNRQEPVRERGDQ